MKRNPLKLVLLASAFVLAGTAACDDANDDVQPNPSFTAGTNSKPEPDDDGGSGGNAPGTAGSPEPGSAGSPEPGAGGAAAGAGPVGVGGEGGTPEQPPYDCVLHPKTHLDIINACTDAVRVEKHPVLPVIP